MHLPFHSAPATQPAVSGRSAPADTAPQGRGPHGAASPAAIANRDVGVICNRFGCKAKPALHMTRKDDTKKTRSAMLGITADLRDLRGVRMPPFASDELSEIWYY
jgi:hypothetical protein